jgi:hypothetical protein
MTSITIVAIGELKLLRPICRTGGACMSSPARRRANLDQSLTVETGVPHPI